MELWVLLLSVGSLVGYLVLAGRITALKREIAALASGQSVSGQPAVDDGPLAQTAPSVPLPETSTDTAIEEEPEQVEPPARGASSWGQASDESSDDAPQPEPIAARVAAPTRSVSLEQKIGTRWIVWLGGLMFALGGIFLVRYVVNEGYFGPGARIFMASLLSIGLLALGEKLRRAPSLQAIASLPGVAIPPIITAVGITIAFATAYAAYALYDMLGPEAVFVLLALISVASVLLAAVHGPILGALGLAGSYATPALVSTDDPSVITLFVYLTFVTMAVLALVRLRSWWHIGLMAVAGSGLWSLIAIFIIEHADNLIVLSFYLPITAALFAFTPLTPDAEQAEDMSWRRVLIGVAITVFGVLSFLFVHTEEVAFLSLVSLAAFGIVGALAALRAQLLERELLISVVAVALTLLFWVPTGAIPFELTDAASRGSLSPPGLPVELEFYTIILAAFAIAYGIGGYILLPRVQNRGLWASISAAFPVFILATIYWRSTALETSMAWGLVAGLVAAIAAYAASTSRSSSRGSDGAVGAYATAALAALSLGLAMVLRDAWLTASLSLLLVGIAWINASLALPLLRWVVLIVAGIVTVRLTFNPALASYDISTTPIFNFLLYAYALPAAAMAVTATWMRRQRDDLIVQCLEAGAALLLTLFISLEIHHWISGGDLFSDKYEFGERAIQTLTWLALSFFYYRLGQRYGRSILTYAGEFLRWLGLAHLLLTQLLLGNPLLTPTFVGDLFLFNLLTLAYLAPALFTALYSVTAKERGDRQTALWFGGATLVLLLTFATLQIRQVFQGGDLPGGDTSDMEWYVYSIVWLLIGVGLFSLSFYRGGRDLRLAAMMVITLATAKGFLFDMAALTGFLRAISFIGFGGALIGIGLLYQRFVFPPKTSEENKISP
jgi:uncharacterized membrane protein